MTFTIEGQLLETTLDTLQAATAELTKTRENNQQLCYELEANRLLTESDAILYLGRDAATIRFYRKNGLQYFKKGRDIWYLKADIDAWLASGKVNRHSR